MLPSPCHAGRVLFPSAPLTLSCWQYCFRPLPSPCHVGSTVFVRSPHLVMLAVLFRSAPLTLSCWQCCRPGTAGRRSAGGLLVCWSAEGPGGAGRRAEGGEDAPSAGSRRSVSAAAATTGGLFIRLPGYLGNNRPRPLASPAHLGLQIGDGSPNKPRHAEPDSSVFIDHIDIPRSSMRIDDFVPVTCIDMKRTGSAKAITDLRNKLFMHYICYGQCVESKNRIESGILQNA